MVALAGGFAGNSLILRPHLEREHLSHPRRQRRQQQVQNRAPALQEVFALVRKLTHLSIGILDFTALSPAELQTARELLLGTIGHLQGLQQALRNARRDDPAPEWSRMLTATAYWERMVWQQANDLQRFERNHLGSTPAIAQEVVA